MSGRKGKPKGRRGGVYLPQRGIRKGEKGGTGSSFSRKGVHHLLLGEGNRKSPRRRRTGSSLTEKVLEPSGRNRSAVPEVGKNWSGVSSQKEQGNPFHKKADRKKLHEAG